MTGTPNLPRSTNTQIADLRAEIEAIKRGRYPGLRRLPNGDPLFTGPVIIGGPTPQKVVGIGGDAVPAPTALVVTPGTSFDVVFLDLSWAAPDPTALGGDQIVGYEVAWKKTAATVWNRSSTAATSFHVEPLEPTTTYDIEVRGISKLGNLSLPLVGAGTTTKDTNPPSAPTWANPATFAGIQSLGLRWQANTERDVADGAGQYRVVISRQADGSVLRDFHTGGTGAFVTALPAEALNAVVYAVDSSGNASAASTVQTGTPLLVGTADLGPTIAIGGGNLVRNSSFEADTDNDGLANDWTASGNATGARSLDAAVKRFGSRSQRVQITNSTGAAQNFRQFQDIDLPATDPVVFSTYVRIDALANCDVRMTIEWYAGNDLIAETTTNVVSTAVDNSKFVRLLSGALTPPATATKARVYVGLRTTAVGGTGLAYFDGVQAEHGTVATAYAPRPTEILPGTIGTTEIADNAVTTPKLVAGAVVTGTLAAGAVTADKIAAATITGDRIAANTITAANIAAATITGNEIAAGTIVANNIAAQAITADKLVADVVLVGRTIRSQNFVTGTSGFSLSVSAGGVGTVEANAGVFRNIDTYNMTVRGTIAAATLASNDFTIDSPTSGWQVARFRLASNGSNYNARLMLGAAANNISDGTQTVYPGLYFDGVTNRYYFDGAGLNAPPFTFLHEAAFDNGLRAGPASVWRVPADANYAQFCHVSYRSSANFGFRQHSGGNADIGGAIVHVIVGGLTYERFRTSGGNEWQVYSLPALAGTTLVRNGTSSQIGPTSSSIRFKEGVTELPDKWRGAGNPLLRVPVKQFFWNADVLSRSPREAALAQVGLIAEEVHTWLPNGVWLDETGRPTALNEFVLIGHLVEAAQASHQRAVAAEARLSLAEARLAVAEARITTIEANPVLTGSTSPRR